MIRRLGMILLCFFSCLFLAACRNVLLVEKPLFSPSSGRCTFSGLPARSQDPTHCVLMDFSNGELTADPLARAVVYQKFTLSLLSGNMQVPGALPGIMEPISGTPAPEHPSSVPSAIQGEKNLFDRIGDRYQKLQLLEEI